MNIEQVLEGGWLATGKGYDRPIVAEGGSQAEAQFNYMEVYGNQYASAQALTALYLVED
jgi:hypothetical protein